ncbi:hypothetical protein GCM10028778_11660 [Barrientosiimonas marina]|uniref:YjcQ family protein n=1 Tax=Lentibacillus kimchii TaxID=1542911 RepID=A0ABW2UWK9_9BACI
MANDTNDIILAVLKFLDESMDDEKVDFSKVNEESLNVTHPRYCKVLSMMLEENLIAGLAPVNFADRQYTEYKAINPRITLKGIEYLDENTLTNKGYKILKEIKDWIPMY